MATSRGRGDDLASQHSSAGSSAEFLRASLQRLRIKLLDLTNRNRLLNFKFSETSRKLVRIVDELPDPLFERLNDETIPSKRFYFEALPQPEGGDDLESTGAFQKAMDLARFTDDRYKAVQVAAERGALPDDAGRQAEEDLKADVRKKIRGAASANRPKINLTEWARKHRIDPSFDLPTDDKRSRSSKHEDNRLQTLLLPDAMERKLSGVREAANLAEQELGLSTLYAAFGFLEWYESQDSSEPKFAPLVLLPLKIDRELKKGHYRYFVESGDGDAVVNLTLRERLRRDFQMELPQFEEEETPESYFTRVATIIADFQKWKVRRFIVIGHFSFARLAMFEDLDPDKWPDGLDTNALLTSLLVGSDPGDSPTSYEYELDTEEADHAVPLLITDADSSQFCALMDAMSGRSFALKGPPGTGKSQTITNLIAAALAKGKKVLFVAEKMAALEVVGKRLRDAKLAPFLLELHSTKVQKKKVLQSFAERLDTRTATPKSYLNDTREHLKKVRSELSRYVALLNSEVGLTGKTFHEILWLEQRARRELGPEAYNVVRQLRETDAMEVTSHSFAARHELLCTFSELFGRCVLDAGGDISKHPLSSFDCTYLSPIDATAFLDELRAWAEIGEKLENVRSSAGRGLRCTFPETLAGLQELCDRLLHLPEPMQSVDTHLLPLLVDADSAARLRNCERALRKLLAEEDSLSQSFRNLPVVLDQLHTYLDMTALVMHACEALRISVRLPPSVLVNHFDGEQTRGGAMLEFLARVSRIASSAKSDPLLLTTDELDCVRQTTALLYETSEAVIRVRRDSLYGEEMAGLLADAEKTAAKLLDRQGSLGEQFDLDALEPAGALKEFAQILRATHPILRMFSNRFKQARGFFTRISRGRKCPALEAADALEQLASFQRDMVAFSANEDLRSAFGPSFRGVKTPFETLIRANQFATAVRRKFSNLDERQKRYRDLLLVGDTQLLVDIRDVLQPDDFQSFAEYVVAQPISPDADVATVLKDRVLHAAQGASTARQLCDLPVDDKTTAIDVRTKLETASAYLTMRKSLMSSTDAQEARLTVASPSMDDADRISRALLAAERVFALQLPSDIIRVILSPIYVTAVEKYRKAAEILEISRRHYDVATVRVSNRLRIPVEHLDNVSASLQDRVARIRTASAALESGVSNWCNFCRIESEGRKRNLGFVLDAVRSGIVPGQLAASVYDFVHRRSVIRSIHEAKPELSSWTGESLSSLRRRLGSLDNDYIDHGQVWLRSTLAQAHIPAGIGRGPKREWTDRALIENEIPKQKKVLSIRTLLERSLPAAVAMKPCFMMSPASVAQFLPQQSGVFDLVVIDEASQMRPEDAVGCVARGSQVVVVGDPMQLPPSSFFDLVEVDDSLEESDEHLDSDSESILDQALSRLRPHRELRWHYRSKHHSLIAFSNAQFYGDQLIVFPSPAEKSGSLGVEYLYVEGGRYHSSVNPIEADEVLERTVQLMMERPDDSIGVVAINQPQQQLLAELFDRRFAEDPALEDYRLRHAESLEPFFVKNLENVQGDERDVIVISTVYGPSQPGGPVAQRFGPINSKMGHRRLNVLFTRAKQRVVLITSLRSEDIQITPQSSFGVTALKGYLEFARSGRLEAGRAPAADDFDSPFEAEVAGVLRQAGYQVASQVGVAGYFLDLAVRHPSNPDHFILGVECDGATYHSARCARDRDKLRQQILESLGWNLFRIWSTDWFSDRPREVHKLTSHLQGLIVKH